MSEKGDMQVEESKAAYSIALPERKAVFSRDQCNLMCGSKSEVRFDPCRLNGFAVGTTVWAAK
jgi:hypothetical protein